VTAITRRNGSSDVCFLLCSRLKKSPTFDGNEADFTMTSIQSLLQIAEAAAVEAGKAIMAIYRSGVIATAMKKENLPVTRADRAAHGVISRLLAKTNLPVLSEEGRDIAYSQRKNWDSYWLIDPLDGTEEFIHQRDEFTVNIALMRKQAAVGGVIYVPCLDWLYVGSAETGVLKKEKNSCTSFAALPARATMEELKQKEKISIAVSRSHLSAATTAFVQQFKTPQLLAKGSSLKFMMLLEGQAEIYPRLGPTMEWDTAAAHAILNAAGRGIYQLDLQAELTYNKPDLHNPSFLAF
jgi:3'(2'), 5'-bisphosphate nucleotidase